MNNCPKCGTRLWGNEAVCECGEILWGGVTNVSKSWETETVFRPVKQKLRTNYIAPFAVVCVGVAAMFVLAWPRLSEYRRAGDQTVVATSDQPVQSDITSSPELVQTDSVNSGVDQAGVFDFSSGRHAASSTRTGKLTRPATDVSSQLETMSSNDLQLSGERTDPKRDDNSLSDCKPQVTASLKMAEPVVPVNEPKPLPKQNTISYILGPRGGCFFVTASGGKKYVDHSLCASSTTVAARQD